MVLKEPLEEFFGKAEKLEWLRAKVQDAGGDPVTVDETLTSLLDETARLQADAQSLVLPGLQAGSESLSIRTTRMLDEVMGSILDDLQSV